jgi:hypothetical protein
MESTETTSGPLHAAGQPYDPTLEIAERIDRLDPPARERLLRLIARSMPIGQTAAAVGRMLGGDAFGTSGGGAYPLREELGLENVEDAFTYHPWGRAQADAGELVREGLVFAAKAILRNVPRGPLRTRALNHLIDGRMIANAAITFGGRF